MATGINITPGTSIDAVISGTNRLVVTTTGVNSTVVGATTPAAGTFTSLAATTLTLTNPLTVPNGGTGDNTFSANQVIIGGTTSTGALQQVSGGTSGYVLTSNGPTAAPTWQPESGSSNEPPTVQFFSSSAGSDYMLVSDTAISVVATDTYSDGTNTVTILASSTSAYQFYVSSTPGTPSGGTLTIVTGTGPSPITFVSVSAADVYTTPTSPRTPLYITVTIVGGGGGAAGAGDNADGGSGTDGQSTGFGPIMVAFGGKKGDGVIVQGGAGGYANLADSEVGLTTYGSAGGNGTQASINNFLLTSGAGGSSAFGGGGQGGYNTAGGSVGRNGGGGGGGGASGNIGQTSGSGGGGAGCAIYTYTSPAATYYYSVGSGGSGGSAGTNGTPGGAGGDGFIYVQEFYE